MSETTIKLPVRLIYVDNILSDTHQIVDVNGKRVSKRAIVTALNESDALRGEVEGLRTAIISAMRETCDIRQAIRDGKTDDLVVIENSFYVIQDNLAMALQAYAALKGQGEQNG